MHGGWNHSYTIQLRHNNMRDVLTAFRDSVITFLAVDITFSDLSETPFASFSVSFPSGLSLGLTPMC